MPALSRKALAFALSTAAIAATLSVPTPAVAGPDPCGVTVDYDGWQRVDSVTRQRKWYWTFYNCGSASAKRKIIIGGGPDVCKTAPARGYATYIRWESESWGINLGSYDGTGSC
ncbi:hypothetical protein [Plantactinospora sp. B24E8]|uniref:hypothetical protein n=1 Tax=Plantactinospora sp. B24E8 TaxID=3153567 RepID=UPI00325E16CF